MPVWHAGTCTVCRATETTKGFPGESMHMPHQAPTASICLHICCGRSHVRAWCRCPREACQQRCVQMHILYVQCSIRYSAQLGSGSESGMRMGGQKQSTKSSKDGWYDFGGWVLLIGITVGIMALARNSQPVAVGPPAK